MAVLLISAETALISKTATPAGGPQRGSTTAAAEAAVAEVEAQESFRPAVAADSGSVFINIADGACLLHVGGRTPQAKRNNSWLQGVWS